jgi:hypothetical protein
MAKIFGQLEKAQLENTTSDTGSLPKGMSTYRTDLNVAKISNGTSMIEVVDASTAQTLSTKTLASPITTGAVTSTQTTTPSTPSAGFNKTYFKTDGFFYELNPAGTEKKVGDIDPEFDAGNSSTSKTIDFANGYTQKLTMTGNCTLTLSNPKSGANYILRLLQDGTGSRTMTWPVAVKWPSGTAPTLTTTAAKNDLINLYYDGTSYYGSFVLNY